MDEALAISAANLAVLESNMKLLNERIAHVSAAVEGVDSHVGQVESNVMIVTTDVQKLAAEFHDYVDMQVKVNEKQIAQADLITVRQKLEQDYGQFNEVRKHATGILQADDLSIVRKETITTASEELMLKTPGYWLTPCLIALSAWINDKPDLAARALKEGIKRDDEKTSLFFALICRRAGRKQACLEWTQRYLAYQDEENLDRKCIIILDAYASGLLGADTEGVIARQMDKWISHLEETPGFVEKQTEQWSDAISLKRRPIDSSLYPYLRKYSRTWPQLEDVLQGAYLHADMLSYLISIFEQKVSTASIKEQLDEILDSLVSDFDEVEIPLRKKEKLDELIIEFEGDKKLAQQHMDIEESAFETHKDFTQLLTDAAMKPESSHASVSTQKFAFALSKNWVSDAYNDLVAKNRMKVPNEIEINVDTFNDRTVDGRNEQEVIQRFVNQVENEKRNVLSQCVLSGFEKICLYAGIGLGVFGIIMFFFAWFLGVLCIIAGIVMVAYHFSKKKKVDANRQAIEKQFEQKKDAGIQIIRAVIAEVVDFRREFASRDAESENVTDFINQITPDQYVVKLSDSNRRIRV